MLKVGAIGFGGGSALIPVIEKELVGKLEGEDEFSRDVMIACITPGALPVEIASGAGRRKFGRLGMVAGGVAVALPGVAMTMFLCLLSFFMDENADLGLIQILFKVIRFAVSVYICILLCRYIFKVFNSIDNKRSFVSAILISLSSALMTVFGHIPTYCIVIGFMAIVLVISLFHKTPCIIDKSSHLLSGFGRDLSFWLAFLLVMLLPAIVLSINNEKVFIDYSFRAIVSSLISFGGGDAYLAIADDMFCRSGLLTTTLFYGSIAVIVNILPGSILCKTLSAIGFFIGASMYGTVQAILFFIAGFGISVTVSCLSFGLCSHAYESLKDSFFFTACQKWIRPVICGLLVNVMIKLISGLL